MSVFMMRAAVPAADVEIAEVEIAEVEISAGELSDKGIGSLVRARDESVALSTGARSTVRPLWSDYLELTKPRISALVLVTVAVSAFMAHWGPPNSWLLLHTLIGTALVAASASALNQRLERRTDALMDRTANRPMPAGRLSDSQVLWFGGLTIFGGLCYLAIAVGLLTAALGAATWLLYVAIYTPLKARTPLNTVVGAVAGALPTLMGWTAVGGSLSFDLGGGGLKAATLFLIVYLWQFPHFMAIAWIYRRQYSQAGLKMLTVVDPTGWRAAAQAVAAALALVPVSLMPILQHAGPIYFLTASVLGLIYLAAAGAFWLRRDEQSARRLLRVSLVYLPALLLLFMLVPLV
jgi:protoheme IX farnesyltransferase